MKIGERLNICANWVANGLAFVMLSFLMIISVLYYSDGYQLNFNAGRGIVQWIVGGVSLLVVWWIIGKLTEKSKGVQITLIVILFSIAVFFCAWWIKNSANLPQSDEKSIYDIALRAKNHDLLPIAPKGSYMSLWPFQAGLVLFEEIILRIMPRADEMTIQWFYIPLMAISLISAYMVVHKMFHSFKSDMLWCILMLLYFPYYFYVNNMYGEVPSMAFMFFSLWMLLEWLEKAGKVYFILCGISMAGAVAVRKNVLIYGIAVALILFILWVKEQKKRYIAIILLMIISVLVGTYVPRFFYEYRAHNTMGEGVPAMAYIAMGLQWDEGRAAGSWNGYNSDVYMECDYDRQLTVELSKKSIEESLDYFSGNIGYAFKFYYNKLVEQWAREDASCLYSTLEFYGDRTQSAWSIYQGKAKDVIMYIMSVQQTLIIMGAIFWCILNIKRCSRIENLILLVTFIGGFLFSMLWEASARYVLPYYIAIIPYAADGYRGIFEKTEFMKKVNLG